MICDTWHMTSDTWHVTCDECWGLNILSKFQLPSSYGLGETEFWRYFNERITEWLNQWISDKGVCRSAPATPGMLKILYTRDHLTAHCVRIVASVPKNLEESLENVKILAFWTYMENKHNIQLYLLVFFLVDGWKQTLCSSSIWNTIPIILKY